MQISDQFHDVLTTTEAIRIIATTEASASVRAMRHPSTFPFHSTSPADRRSHERTVVHDKDSKRLSLVHR
jgi:hypothetical protein